VRTGGLLYENADASALPALFSGVIRDFRTSYLLSYTPRGVRRDGWHDVDVRTKDKRYVVRARSLWPGYSFTYPRRARTSKRPGRFTVTSSAWKPGVAPDCGVK